MTEPVRPPHDVDALARRLPRRALPAPRMRALRGALLDAAQPAARRAPRAPSRWTLGWAAVAVATTAAAAVLVLRGEPAPATPQRAAVAAAHSTPTAIEPSLPDPASTAPPAATTDDRAAGRLAGLAAERTAGPQPPSLQLAPPPSAAAPVPPVGAAASRTAAAPPASTAASASASPERAGSASPSKLPPSVAQRAGSASPSKPPPGADQAPSAPPSPAGPAAVTAPSIPNVEPASPERAPGAAASDAAAIAERAFRDGLQALLAGDARAARAPLDRACATAASGREDSCYWAAVAWLRTGDRARARRGFADLLAHWPSSTHAGEASVTLGWLLLETGDRAAARARFAAAAGDAMPAVRAEAQRGLAASQAAR